MSSNITLILNCIEGSAFYTERIITLQEGESINVTRAEGEDIPSQDNAVFDSKVIDQLIPSKNWLETDEVFI